MTGRDRPLRGHTPLDDQHRPAIERTHPLPERGRALSNGERESSLPVRRGRRQVGADGWGFTVSPPVKKARERKKKKQEGRDRRDGMVVGPPLQALQKGPPMCFNRTGGRAGKGGRLRRLEGVWMGKGSGRRMLARPPVGKEGRGQVGEEGQGQVGEEGKGQVGKEGRGGGAEEEQRSAKDECRGGAGDNKRGSVCGDQQIEFCKVCKGDVKHLSRDQEEVSAVLSPQGDPIDPSEEERNK
ncbi:hypothetical protein PTTG_07973 [Puccinia triticina 1-1 BBBD Race 1]|uniref:Uncharacterized protein n=1 Tax=Puccinia triticina (isolate 1-1 / race 1 (BBBD)) TaxID=630390 RepID=A0A0C4F4D3_PUCT1|nr:hypothetical protein PTTG_07973 [Puccinia triticina 1-1 BBBD Race 1]